MLDYERATKNRTAPDGGDYQLISKSGLYIVRVGLLKQSLATVGIGKTSVFRYLRTPNFPERQGRSDRGRSVLSPYKEYILKRWNKGYYDTKGLFEIIQRRGYSGSYDTVARYTRRLRSSQGLPLRQRLVTQSLAKVAQAERRPLTAPKSCLISATAPRVTETLRTNS